jgi:hypothetical protein
MFKYSQKSDNIHLCYICNTKKNVASNLTYILDSKNINLGVNSLKYYSSKADTIHKRIYLFCFSTCRLSFELNFFGVVDTTNRYFVFFFQVFLHFVNMILLADPMISPNEVILPK